MIVMVLTLFIVGFLLRGYFVPFLRVKMSFGKNILVRVRQIHTDIFRVGKVEEGMIIFDKVDGKARIKIPKGSFYFSWGIKCIDIDDDTNAVIMPDMKGVEGFDAVKFDELIKRSIYRASASDRNEKIIMGMCFLIIALVIVVGFLVYKNGYGINFITQNLGGPADSAIIQAVSP